MNIGIAVDGKSLDSIVSEEFCRCNYLLVVTINDHLFGEPSEIIKTTVIENENDNTEFNLAQELVRHNCEAVITGALQPSEFELIADSCITRYHGAGLQASIALEKMEKRELNMIRNLEGTSNCDDHHHKH
jgi:predicted Fe-Mo cluster-binding NifX family protein